MYDMKRHWDSKHKGMEMKYKIVHGVSGVDSLDSHGFKSSTSSNKNWGRLHWRWVFGGRNRSPSEISISCFDMLLQMELCNKSQQE